MLNVFDWLWFLILFLCGKHTLKNWVSINTAIKTDGTVSENESYTLVTTLERTQMDEIMELSCEGDGRICGWKFICSYVLY